MEIALRKVDTTASFGDERMTMPQLSARIID
jgi:hypothetical protein